MISTELTNEQATVANLTMTTSADLWPSPRVLRVAIVEDSRNIRERLVQLVEDNGSMQVVGEADTEESAVAVCRSTAPDAIILDLKLASGTGLGVLKTMCYAGRGTQAGHHRADQLSMAGIRTRRPRARRRLVPGQVERVPQTARTVAGLAGKEPPARNHSQPGHPLAPQHHPVGKRAPGHHGIT